MSAWLKRLKDALEELGVSFEAEESVRIHVGDIIVEVGVEEGGGKYTVTISMPLPSSSSTSDELDYYRRLYEQALKVLLGLRGDVKYEVDTSLPDYPSLHMIRVYDDADKMVDDLINLLKRLKEELPAAGGGEAAEA